MYPFPENLSINLNLCVNCNNEGSNNEINIVTNTEVADTDILNVKVLGALEYLYNIPWNNFTDKLKKQPGINKNLDVDNDQKILLCQTCTPLVAESYRLQKNLESFSHSQSLLHLAKQLCTFDNRNSPHFNSQGNDEESDLVNQEEDVDNISFNDFTFGDDGSGKEGCDENYGDDEIEIKYEPTPDLSKSHSKNLNELRVVLHKISQPTLNSVLNRKQVISPENTSKKRKNSKPAEIKTKNCEKRSTVNAKVVSRSLRPIRTPTRKTANKSNLKGFEDNVDNAKVLKSSKNAAVKEKPKMDEKEVLEPNGEDSVKTSSNDVDKNDESAEKNPPKKKREKRVEKDESEKIPIEYKCKLCPEVFSKRYNLEIHKRLHKTRMPTPANPEEPYKCDLCGKICQNFRNYKYYHLRRQHREKYNVTCHICGKTFLRVYLLTHIRTIHLDEEEREKTKMECKICGKKIQKATIKKHMKVHDEDREKFICECCGKTYQNKEKLQLHKLMHDPNPKFSCKTCGKYFAGKYALQRHEMRHDGDKAFACDICGKSFIANYMLARHKVMHQEERPFQCLKCGKDFKSAEYLNVHDKGTHGGIRQAPKDYSCSICARIFKTKKQLDVHTDADHDINNTLY